MREIMSRLGVRTVDELVGRTDKLKTRDNPRHWKAGLLDLSAILYQPYAGAEVGRRCLRAQNHSLEKSLGMKKLLRMCKPALEYGTPIRAKLKIRNVDRIVGTMVGSEITRRYGEAGLPDDTIRLHFAGSAGQSFGAFIPRGLTLELEGDANDYVGKGLSGGRVIIYPPAAPGFVPEENILIGNVAFYGATSGEAFISGIAGERFCVRNSGLDAVVEGVGDHGCEYMTGGRVVVLGKTGRNFAAGMSGGIAYVLDFDRRLCNTALAELEGFSSPEEEERVRALIARHAELTGSPLARRVLDDWEHSRERFTRVIPREYKRIMSFKKEAEDRGLAGAEAMRYAFDQGVRA